MAKKLSLRRPWKTIRGPRRSIHQFGRWSDVSLKGPAEMDKGLLVEAILAGFVKEPDRGRIHLTIFTLWLVEYMVSNHHINATETRLRTRRSHTPGNHA